MVDFSENPFDNGEGIKKSKLSHVVKTKINLPKMQTFAFYVTNPFALFLSFNFFLSKYFSKGVCRFYSRVCYSGPLWIGIKPLASEVKLSCIIISNYLSWTILNFSFCIPYFTVKLLLFTIYNMAISKTTI